MRTLLSWLSLGTLALAGMPAPAGAQPVGSEFQVNTYTTETQRPSGGRAVAADAHGNFVVVWESQFQDGSHFGVFGQRYDADGVAQGGEFRVNTYTTGNQYSPTVTSSGTFVVVWDGRGQGDLLGIFAQRYDGTGQAQGAEFRVNSYTTDYQHTPSVASDASGNFVVVWQSEGQDGSDDGIFGQRFDSQGVAQGSEFRVNSYTTGLQEAPSVASDASGNFVVVWQSRQRGGSDDAIFGQRFDSQGVPQGSEFRVDSDPGVDQASPSVARDANGNFVVVWYSEHVIGYSVRHSIYGQRYDSEGVAQGDAFLVDDSSAYRPSVASDGGGDFVVVWESGDDRDGSDYGIFGQRYDSEGVPQGDVFQVNSYTTSAQDRASVASGADGNVVVIWQSFEDVFGQRYDFSGAQTITVVSPNANVKWRIGSLQRIQWTHNLGANATFLIELDRDDDGTFEEVIAAAAPVDSTMKGSFAWTVTGPRSGTARVRVAWTDDPSVSDSSDVTFQIRPVGLD